MKVLPAVAPVVVALSLARPLPAVAARPVQPSQAELIALQPYMATPLRTVNVTLNGQTHRFLFDTGGGLTIISPQLAAASPPTG